MTWSSYYSPFIIVNWSRGANVVVQGKKSITLGAHSKLKFQIDVAALKPLVLTATVILGWRV